MTMHRILCSFALVTVAGACGVKSVGDLDDTGGSDGSASESTGSASDSASATGNTSVSATDGPGTDDGTGSSSVGESSSGDDGSCPPFDGSICDPQEQFGPEAATWVFDQGDAFDANLVDVQCTIAEFATDDVNISMTLECDEGELSQHTLVVPHNPITPLNLGIGTAVRLTYRADTPFWTNQWFALHAQDGRFVLGGVQSSELLPADAPDLFAPVGVSLLDDVCDVEPDCGEICGPIRRNAIGVAVGDGEQVTIYDGNSGVVGSPTTYTFVVGDAQSSVGDTGCKDAPDAWYAIIAYDSSEG